MRTCTNTCVQRYQPRSLQASYQVRVLYRTVCVQHTCTGKTRCSADYCTPCSLSLSLSLSQQLYNAQAPDAVNCGSLLHTSCKVDSNTVMVQFTLFHVSTRTYCTSTVVQVLFCTSSVLYCSTVLYCTVLYCNRTWYLLRVAAGCFSRN